MVSEVSRSTSYEILPSKKEAGYDWMNNSPLVGRELEMNDLRQYATKPLQGPTKVVSVWGMAGVGKSALVRNLYHDKMYEHFSSYSWVDVSHPFNLNDFCWSILFDTHSEEDPVEECRKFLNNNQCLIVIDDLRTKREWDMIQATLLSQHSVSVIIVITSDATIARYCASHEDLVFHVKSLEHNAAIELFKEVHQKNPSSFLVDHKNEDLRELVVKCGRLPEVIVSVANVLARQTAARMDNVLSLNERFIHHLETKPEYDNLRGLFAWMDSIFRTCPDSLKPCIFYLPIFGPDLFIRRRRLVRRWIAEGYSRDNHEESAEENGEKHFSNLFDLSLIQKESGRIVTAAPSDTRMVICQTNGFMNEYIVSRRMEENFVLELRGHYALTTRTVRHLIIHSSWDRDETVFKSIDFSKLRSLTVFGKLCYFFLREQMKLLRVLDLENAVGIMDGHVECMVERLPRLKFLSLRGCDTVYNLPRSLGDLKQLQTLDVRGTSILILPLSIIKLHNLQYIRAGNKMPQSVKLRLAPLFGVAVPGRIGYCLTALHTLGVVNISASDRNIIWYLKKLTQLRKLGVAGINKNNSKEFFSAINCHVHLESLSVQLKEDSQDCLDGHIESLSLRNLRSLKIYGLKDNVPEWRERLSKIPKLRLEMATLNQDEQECLAVPENQDEPEFLSEPCAATQT